MGLKKLITRAVVSLVLLVLYFAVPETAYTEIGEEQFTLGIEL